MLSKLIVIAGAMSLVGFAAAQEAPIGPAKGVKTANVLLSYMSVKPDGGNEQKQTDLQLVGSYFFTNSLAARLGYGYQKVESGSASSTTDVIILGARYYLGAGQALSAEKPLAPFAGAFFRSDKWPSVDRANGFGAELGAEYFLQPNVSLTPVFSYVRSHTQGVNVDGWQFSAGLTVWFK